MQRTHHRRPGAVPSPPPFRYGPAAGESLIARVGRMGLAEDFPQRAPESHEVRAEVIEPAAGPWPDGAEVAAEALVWLPLDTVAELRRLVQLYAYRWTRDAGDDSEEGAAEEAEREGPEATLWVIRAGPPRRMHEVFQSRGVIALGWPEVGDLRRLTNRFQFRNRVRERYSDLPAHARGVAAGQLDRFVNEAREGDVVAYLTRPSHLVHLGRIAGPYRYDPEAEPAYPHQRPVKWERAVAPSRFSASAVQALGRARGFSQVGVEASALHAALAEDEPSTAPAEGPEPVERAGAEASAERGFDADEADAYIRDWIIGMLSEKLKGHPLAHLVADLLRTLGYHTRVSPPGPDRGVDIVAHRDLLGVEPPILKVQVKSGERAVGDPEVSALYGKVAPSEVGLLVTLGGYSRQAVRFAQERPNLRLIDGRQLVELLLLNYEQLDARYRDLVPLRRVYVPDER